MSKDIISTPWDSRIFGFNTFEILFSSEDNLKKSLERISQEKGFGHYTVKINPLASKKELHEYGLYYCDTLIEPYCTPEGLIKYDKEGIHLSELIEIDQLINIAHGAFTHGRFHRDFNLNKHLADMRYDTWLKELWEAKQVFALMYFDDIAGFWGFSNHQILLHALSEQYRGKSLAKYFWSVACERLFGKGYSELTSSISVSNVPVLNLYSSLGFKFRNPVDVYHWFIEK